MKSNAKSSAKSTSGYRNLGGSPSDGPWAWFTTSRVLLAIFLVVMLVLAIVGVWYAVDADHGVDRLSRLIRHDHGGSDDDDAGGGGGGGGGSPWDRGPVPDAFAGGAGYSNRKRLAFYTDMAHFDPGNDGLNFYFESPGFVGNGWNISRDAQGVLTLSSTPYNLTVPQVGDGPCPSCAVDHVKALAYYNRPASLPDDGTEVFFGGHYACDISGLEDQPFGSLVPDADDDIRLAACALNSVALPGFGETASNRMGVWTVADLFLSKGRRLRNGLREFLVYGIYEVLPFGNVRFGGNLGDYWAGTHAIPLGRVTSRDGWVRLAISFNRKRGTIRYWVEGRLRHSVENVGKPIDVKYRILDHGGVPAPSFPHHMFFGRGIFTLLDAYRPNNLKMRPNSPLVQLDSDASHYLSIFGPGSPTFYDPDSLRSNRLFGQRTTLRIRYESVWTEKPREREHEAEEHGARAA